MRSNFAHVRRRVFCPPVLRALVMAGLFLLLLPILFGGIGGYERRRLTFIQTMRDEHRRAVEVSRQRRAEREAREAEQRNIQR